MTFIRIASANQKLPESSMRYKLDKMQKVGRLDIRNT